MCGPCGCSVPTPCAYGVVVGGNRVVCYQEASEMMNFLIKKFLQIKIKTCRVAFIFHKNF